MRSHVENFGKSVGRAVWLAGAVFAFMAANQDNGCEPDAPAGGTEAECQVASDCQGDPAVDCVGAWACNTGTCAFECGQRPPPATGCYDNGDCTGGLVCNAGPDDVCHTPPGCRAGETCAQVCYGECVRPPDPPTGCTSSGQCAVGEFCTTEIGVCNNTCAPGMACPAVCYGECKPRQNGSICYDDSQCGPAQTCDRDPCVFPDGDSAGASDRMACGGVCVGNQGCNTTDDCDAGEVCGCAAFPGNAPPNGLMPCYLQCIPSEPACASDNDCVNGQVCQNGACIDPQRECSDGSQCPTGWACESQCNSAGASDASGDAARPYCPSICVPQGGTCADDGTVCAPGETCVNECVMVCADCACEAGTDCPGCGCWEECRSACVPEYGGCDPSQCPDGTHCGCPDMPFATPANGLFYCEEKCIDDQPQTTCSSDSDCRDDQQCVSNCLAPAPCADPSGADCAARPAPPCAGTCEPKPAFECSTDSECVSPDGRQGTCIYAACDRFAAPPCDPADASCMPAPTCHGFCNYDSATCDPSDPAACPRGTHCEASSGCGGAGGSGGAEFRPCLVEYQCMPDVVVVACRTDCDCSSDTACVGGECSVTDRMNECQQGPDCTSDDQCHDGDFCKIDYSQPVCDCVNCPCSIPHGTCVPNPPTDCKVDADCLDTQHCEFYYPPCAPPPTDPSFAPPPQCEPIGMCEAGPPRR